METGYIRIVQEEGQTPSVEVELANDNIWLSKYDIAKLFNCFHAKIEMNLRNIFKKRLLWEDDVSLTYRYTQKGIEKLCVYYNLEVLIFLSYRIGTYEAKIFRQFVNNALREHLQKRGDNGSAKLFWHFYNSQDYWLN